MAIITRWRMPPDSWCGYSSSFVARRGDADARQQLDGPLPGLSPPETTPWRSKVSPICPPIVSTGFSAVIGSWKIMLMRRAAEALHAASRQLRAEARPSKSMRSAVTCRDGRQQAHDRLRRDALAAAGFADDAEHLSITQFECDSVNDGQSAERDRQAGDFKQRRLIAHPGRFTHWLTISGYCSR